VTATLTTDWNPGTYHRFRGQRLRPALDLIAALPDLPPGDIVDLGCGAGASGPALSAFARPVHGVDLSPAMLAEARATGAYASLTEADISRWTATDAPALIYSNAALHWLGDHATLLPRLAGMLARGGTLAVQMPHQNNAPSHRVWVSLMAEHFPGRFDPATSPGILPALDYHRLLSPLGQLSLWETEYYQVLDACPDGAHPVRRFTEATFARPILAVLDAAEQAQLIAAYEDVMTHIYPPAADGSVLFPFRRLFLTLTV
jgi:trans-aconitate 2-methyltransferase